MRKNHQLMRICTVMLLAMAILTIPAYAATPEENRATITVSGNGKVTVAPDTASFSVQIEADGKTASAAQQENANIQQKVHAALLEAGIAQEDLETGYCYTYPKYRYDEKEGNTVLDGYRAECSFQVTTQDIDHLGKYIDCALAAGATGYRSPSFFLKDESAAYAQALQAAAKNAAASAQSIANAFGKPLGGIQSVQETSRGSYFTADAAVNETMSSSAADSLKVPSVAQTEIHYSDIEITASLHVVYYF